jgi:hypothetical protein
MQCHLTVNVFRLLDWWPWPNCQPSQPMNTWFETTWADPVRIWAAATSGCCSSKIDSDLVAFELNLDKFDLASFLELCTITGGRFLKFCADKLDGDGFRSGDENNWFNSELLLCAAFDDEDWPASDAVLTVLVRSPKPILREKNYN